jgi:glycosyltransferase involved in cell wall biosynthesis
MNPKTDLKIVIGAAQHKFSHLQEFANMFEKLGGHYKLVLDTDYVNGFPSKKFKNWFNPNKKFKKLISEFNPDLVFIDRQSQFGVAAIKSHIPLFVHLRGDYWSELTWSKQTINSSIRSKGILYFKDKIAKQCFEKAHVILPLSNYLSNVVRDHYPEKQIETFHQGINPDLWYDVKPMNLKHPCVGLIQDATIWGKTKEMLILKKILESLPDVTFYWVGDGPYRERITSQLEKFENFKWLGRLSHPKGVREFLFSIDIYALVTGFDTLGMTTQEAQLMKKPVIVSRTGGTSEAMKENETGYLVELGDHKGWINNITELLNDENKSKQMGKLGREFVIEKFSWYKKTCDFINICKKYL